MRDEIHGDTVNIHVNSKAYAQPQTVSNGDLQTARYRNLEGEITCTRSSGELHPARQNRWEEREPPNLEVYEFASIGSAGPAATVGGGRRCRSQAGGEGENTV